MEYTVFSEDEIKMMILDAILELCSKYDGEAEAYAYAYAVLLQKMKQHKEDEK